MEKKYINIINRISVHKRHLTSYEKWLKGFQETLNSFDGFIELKVDKSKFTDKKGKNEFNLNISFDSYDNLKQWEKTGFQKKYYHKTLEFNEGMSTQPIYWKGFLITILTVYPLILITDFFLGFILPMGIFSPKIALFLNLLFVALLMQYPVMPLTKKYFGNWINKIPTNYKVNK